MNTEQTRELFLASGKLKSTRHLLKNTQDSFTVTSIRVLQTHEKEFEVFAVLKAETPGGDTWDINVKSLDLFFTELK